MSVSRKKIFQRGGRNLKCSSARGQAADSRSDLSSVRAETISKTNEANKRRTFKIVTKSDKMYGKVIGWKLFQEIKSDE